MVLSSFAITCKFPFAIVPQIRNTPMTIIEMNYLFVEISPGDRWKKGFTSGLGSKPLFLLRWAPVKLCYTPFSFLQRSDGPLTTPLVTGLAYGNRWGGPCNGLFCENRKGRFLLWSPGKISTLLHLLCHTMVTGLCSILGFYN